LRFNFVAAPHPSVFARLASGAFYEGILSWTFYETSEFREKKMENLEFGLTLTLFGMGGTLVILFLLGLVMDLLNKILPFREEKDKVG